MKKKILPILAVLAFTLALNSSSSAFEPHPEIQAALGALDNAKAHLEHAAHDFHGHRVDAIRAIDAAQRQLQICMQYDRD